MSKNMNVPKLRFSEFGGDWEEKKLGDIGKVVVIHIMELLEL